MKKLFKTIIDASAFEQESIIFSAGKIGAQIECAPEDLAAVIKGSFADVID